MALGSSGPVEVKVSAATVAAALSSLIVWALQTYWFRGEVPLPVSAAVQVIVPAAAAFVAGFVARHTPRTDVDAAPAAVLGDGSDITVEDNPFTVKHDHALDGDPGEIPATDFHRRRPGDTP